MSESSIFWPTGTVGDGASTYTDTQLFAWLRRTINSDNYASQGPLVGYGGELAVTGAAGSVNIATGAAYVYGIPYESDAVVNVAIPTPTTSTRIDRIVLRANWTAKTVRITRIAGTEGAGAPAITQTPGSIYDVKLAQVSITTGGVITVTDERQFCHYATRMATENLDDAAVTTAKIADGAVTAAKVAADVATQAELDAEAAARAGVQTNLNNHAAATTGVHGVGASAVESTAGAQAKADAVQTNLNNHAANANAHHVQNSASVARQTAELTLTTSYQDVPGCSLSLAAGTWLVVGVLNVNAIGAGDDGQWACGALLVGATIQDGISTWKLKDGTGGTCAQAWVITVSSTTTVKIQAYKTGGTGTSRVSYPHSSITALRVS